MSEDWDSFTVIGQKARRSQSVLPRENVTKSANKLNDARRKGSVVATEKKYGSSNSKSDPEGQRLTKLDATDNVVKVPKIDQNIGKLILKFRQEKKLSQKDLATKVNEKPSVINDYESGKAIPNQLILAKIEKILGIKLRGKLIGEPLFNKVK